MKTVDPSQLEVNIKRKVKLAVYKKVAVISGVVFLLTLIVEWLPTGKWGVGAFMVVVGLLEMLSFGVYFLVLPVFVISGILFLYYFIALKLSSGILSEESSRDTVISSTVGEVSLPLTNIAEEKETKERIRAKTKLMVGSFVILPILSVYLIVFGPFIIRGEFTYLLFYLFFFFVPATVVVVPLVLVYIVVIANYFAKRKK
jgi:hypothetical protein